MKRLWAVLAISAVSGLVGCNSDGTWKSASDDTMDNGNMRNSTAYSTNGAHDTTPNSSSIDYNGRTNTGANQTASNLTSPNQAVASQSTADSSASRIGVTDSNSTAQLNHGNDKTTAGVALTNDDRQFLKDAAASGMYEVQASEKALNKSSDQHVKQVAQHMVDDHTKANDQLKALAQRKGVEITLLPYGDQITMLGRLDSMNGTDFDNEYISQQRKAHEDAIAKFQTASSGSSDRDIRDWAAQTLPALREHLRMINNESSPNLGMER